MNSITLAIDGLQAGMVGALGNTWVQTPELDRLAVDSFLCDQAFATEPRCAAHEAWLGRSPWARPADSLPNTPWFELTTTGLKTAVITDDPVFAQLVQTDVREVLQVPIEPVRRLAKTTEETGFFRLLDTAAEWLDQQTEPFAVWIHARGLLGPWDAPYALREQFADEEDPDVPDFVAPPVRQFDSAADPDELLGIRQAYAGQVALIDQCVGALNEQIKNNGHTAQSLLILLGLRGYPLGEHLRVGFVDDALYSEATQVPVFVRSPDRQGAASRSSALTVLTDIAPTILSWHMQATSSNSHSGLWPLLRGESTHLRDHLLLGSASGTQAIRTPAWLLHRQVDETGTIRQELFAKPDDRFDMSDVCDRCHDVADELAQACQASVTAMQANQEPAPLPRHLLEPAE